MEKQFDEKLFEKIFNEIDTYKEFPKMFEKLSNDIVESSFDNIKIHSICYHLSGFVDIVEAIKNAFLELMKEVKLYDIDIENEIDNEQVEKFNKIKFFFESK